jgi:hypothetical protein
MVPQVEGELPPIESSPDEVFDIETTTRRARPEAPPEPTREPQPARQVARAGRHPAVPSWDDIMFGTRRRD